MKYNFIYLLLDLISGEKYYFSTEFLAFAFADSKAMDNYEVQVIRICYDLGD